MPRASSTVTTDHEEIRRWAEERDAKPACVLNTGDENDIGILRLDFPGYTGADTLREISWDDWFSKFDERGLALLHQETTARGEKSNFNKLVSRETAQAIESGETSGSKGSTGPRSRTARSSSGSRAGAAASGGRISRSTTGRKSGQSRTSRANATAKTGTRAGAKAKKSTTRTASATGRKVTAKSSRKQTITARGRKTSTTGKASLSRKTSASGSQRSSGRKAASKGAKVISMTQGRRRSTHPRRAA